MRTRSVNQAVTQTLETIEYHKTMVWLQKFVPIYLFHFLITLPG